MNGIPTMSPILGVLLLLTGFAFAVLLGLILYRDKNQKATAAQEPLNIQGKVEAVGDRA